MNTNLSFDLMKDRISHHIFDRWGYGGVFCFGFFPMIVVLIISLAEGGFCEIPKARQLGLDEFPLLRTIFFGY